MSQVVVVRLHRGDCLPESEGYLGCAGDDTERLSVGAREGAGIDGRGTRVEDRPGSEIRNAEAGVQDHEDGDGEREAQGDDKSEERAANSTSEKGYARHDEVVQDHGYRSIQREDRSSRSGRAC